MKIDWAPLCVPFHRRVETLTAGSWMILILFGELITLIAFLALFAFSNMYIRAACLLYCAFMYYDRKVGETGGRGQGYVQNRGFRTVAMQLTFTFYMTLLLFFLSHSQLTN